MIEVHVSDTWFLWLRRGLAGLAIAFVLLGTTYMLARIRIVQRNSTELVALSAHLEALRMANDANLRDINNRLDEIERVLFGDVVEKLEKRPPGPNRIELWQQNRDKELRDRILRLERWRAQWGNE